MKTGLRTSWERKLSKTMLGTVGAFGLIEDGDRILVAVSGGKDSATLLDLLGRAQSKAPVHYDLVAFHLDQGQPGYDGQPLEVWLRDLGISFHIHREDTYSQVKKLANGSSRSPVLGGPWSAS